MKIIKPKALIKYCAMGACMLVLLPLGGCFTGIENTGKITMSKKDQVIVAPSEEDLFLSDVNPDYLKDWKSGKRFVVADQKIKLVTENPSNIPVNVGDTIFFREVRRSRTADGGESAVVTFMAGGETISYTIEKSLDEASASVKASDIPMLIDLDMVEAVDRKLKSKTLWTKTSQWYDDSLKYKKGKKFIEVEVAGVECGDSFFPLLINFSEKEGLKGKLLMNIGNSGNDSRSFGRLFSLKDPHLNYKNISPERWCAIQNEELMPGMTKEEVRLSRGNPSDVNTGHDYSTTMEIWYYPNGTYLRFLDGLLVM